jgi:DNA invertase Pin-like site-specific DNA recombinase
MKKYVAYYRVSTQKQGQSGLGLDAQRRMVEGFAKDGQIVADFVEIESGKNNDRVELRTALEYCKKEKATLLIAKLDRLSRNVAFIANLMDAGVDFTACDLPQANRFTLHIFAALAEQEREMISRRTRDALRALKERGAVLGKPENLTTEARDKGTVARVANARTNENNRKAAAMIRSLREQGATFQAIADQLNQLGFPTRRGCRFFPTQVRRLWQRRTVDNPLPNLE